MTMPSDNKSTRDMGDIEKLLAPHQERGQSFNGVEGKYADVVDFIIRVTHEIWEEKGVGIIYDAYQHNTLVHASGGDSYGREEVVAGTLQTMSMFPDRKLFADDVIWTGNEQDGFYTSHHITSTARHTGPGVYGPPTGKKAMYRAIALCYVRENRIVEEWLLRDDLAIIHQLGLDVQKIVEGLARQDLARPKPPQTAGAVERSLGQLPPRPLPPRASEGFDVEDFVRRSVHDIVNRRLFNLVREYYVENYSCHTASERHLYGQSDLTAFLISLLAALPDGRITIDQVFWQGNDRDGYRVSTRWTLAGSHTGWGLYGRPSGAHVEIMGLSQYLIQGGKFVRESTLFDEIGLLRQIEALRLAAQG
ncbi:MAG: ester cyclase [Anaerolineae bacterium]